MRGPLPTLPLGSWVTLVKRPGERFVVQEYTDSKINHNYRVTLSDGVHAPFYVDVSDIVPVEQPAAPEDNQSTTNGATSPLS